MDVYLITPPQDDFLASLESILELGIDKLQYRRTGLSDQAMYRELEKVKRLTRRHEIPLIVNDRPDLALAVNAQGVHLGADDLPVSSIKRQWPSIIVGRTQRTHNPPHDNADYLSVGPVFESTTKELTENPCGWSGVRRVIDRTELPVYAIGGLNLDNTRQAPDQLSGIALIGAVWNAEDPADVVRAFQSG